MLRRLKVSKSGRFRYSRCKKIIEIQNAGYRLRLGQAYASTGDKANGRKEIEICFAKRKSLSQKEVQKAKNMLWQF